MGCGGSNTSNAMADSGRLKGEKGIYEGERNAAGQEEGRGTYRWDTGNVYEGEWKAGQMEGRGTFRYADGGVHEGEWKGCEKEGVGISSFTDGNVSVSVYRQGVEAGEGVGWSADGLQAVRLLDGVPVEAISPVEAQQTAQRLSLPIPAALAGASPAAGVAAEVAEVADRLSA